MWGHPLLALERARGHLFPFVPVLIATGIGLWFLPGWEPGPRSYGAALVLLAAGILLVFRPLLHPLGIAAICIALGFLAAGVRAHVQKAPIIGFRYYGAIEGRVIEVDRSQSDRLRLTLDRVVLERTAPDRTPAKVRLSLHAEPPAPIRPGSTVILTGHLDAPMGPAEPGGFDFRRMAFFDRLGAIGYSRTPVLTLAAPEAGTQWINRLRAYLSAGVQAGIPGQAGAFASGSVTGDRSGITHETTDALRDSNLSHLLAISGMNLAFLVAFTFAILRYGFALVPPLALRLNTKKLAAAASLGVAGFYLALSGGNVATERAFLMSAVMLGAILCDRRALSMRTVALSAVMLLLWQPESLLHPGFQMSMAATVMLVWGFGVIDRRTFTERAPRWLLPVYTAVLSSVLGGLATGPIAAVHFNRFTDYGLLANLLTVPAMGTLIMPGAVVATLLSPFGLPQPGLLLMELGARWILAVAHLIAGWEGAVTGIKSPGPLVLPLMSVGALWLMLWPGRARWGGALALGIALLVWGGHQRPPVLISADGALVGIMGREGRVFSAPKGSGFAAGVWLEDDGDLASQADAAERGGFSGPQGARRFMLGDRPAIHLKGRGARDLVADACAESLLVILAAEVEDTPEGCLVIDRARLAETGAIAVWPDDGRLLFRNALDGSRLWMRQ
ncbi:ComEC/Rec2 family competence protein [Falsirhodobacter xinxiangensis]|uniref:ComEC/Rec2 family competence protein n=1 Tax=Falsirhodobacter xinxiangensis TaxID=2530049 RepID=UPI0010AAA9EB|nr:ComEC/Rec2 family competence protein [Rhodobacter xinxiangensis]